jgi:hypothetical protein
VDHSVLSEIGDLVRMAPNPPPVKPIARLSRCVPVAEKPDRGKKHITLPRAEKANRTFVVYDNERLGHPRGRLVAVSVERPYLVDEWVVVAPDDLPVDPIFLAVRPELVPTEKPRVFDVFQNKRFVAMPDPRIESDGLDLLELLHER